MKKNTQRRLFRSATLLLGLAVTFWLADFFICDDVHDYSRAMLQDLYRQEENIDLLFLGPSHCYRSFDPMLLTDELGIQCFNAGSSQQLYDGSYYMLREAAKTNRLQTVLLEVSNGNTQSSDQVPEACYLLTDYMKNSPERWEYLYEMGGVAALLESLTPARHNTVSPNSALEAWRAKLTDGYEPGNYRYLQTNDGLYRGRGFTYVPYNIGENAVLYGSEDTDPEKIITPFAEEYLDKIITFCRENGIELILVQAPMSDAFLSADGNRQLYMDFFAQKAEQNGLAYWDLNLCRKEVLQMSWRDFSDPHHLSGEGAEKATLALSRLLAGIRPGERGSTEFFHTSYAEKLAQNPDGTLAGN